MRRLIHSQLKDWKQKPDRKPLILKGARQVGKTYLLEEFGRNEFDRVYEVNFEKNPNFRGLFEQDLNPRRIVSEIALALGLPPFRPGEDLLFLDEIQECPKAKTALKYFCEDSPELAVVSAGSLLGVHLEDGSFPVGKVDELYLAPMNFREFLMAFKEDALIDRIEEAVRSGTLPDVVHARLWDHWKRYLITGGLPEVVRTFVGGADFQFDGIREKQAMLISGYLADVAKHSGKVNSMHISRIFQNIPNQLAKNQDGSASRFVFKGVVPKVNAYARLAGAIDWLEAAGLLLKLKIANRAEIPAAAYTKESFFKLYLFDVGLLGALSPLPPENILSYDYGTYKGFFAENFVAQELHHPTAPLVGWEEGNSQIEFLLQYGSSLVPVEVKSGANTQAKSMRTYVQKYHPRQRVILSAQPLSVDADAGVYRIPVFLANWVRGFLERSKVGE